MMLFMLMCFQGAEIKSSIFQEKQCYISTSLLILKEFWLQMTSLSWKLSAEEIFTKYFIIPPNLWTLLFYLYFLCLSLFFMENLCTTHPTVIDFMVRDVMAFKGIFSIFSLEELKFMVYLQIWHWISSVL